MTRARLASLILTCAALHPAILWAADDSHAQHAPGRHGPFASASVEATKALVAEFLHLAFVQRQPRAAYDRFVAADYVQHNPQVPTGRDGAIEFIEKYLADKPTPSYDIKRVVVEGNLVVTHSHWKSGPDDPGSAVVDIFRIDDGYIVEHWDVVQPVAAAGANANTMF